MNKLVWTRVFLPIIIGFSGTSFFIFILLEALGITGHVWPILFPVYTSILGVMVIVSVVVGISFRADDNGSRDQLVAQREYDQSPPAVFDGPSSGATYVVPVYCPHCGNWLELDRVEWIGPGELTCSSCLGVVKAEIREKF